MSKVKNLEQKLKECEKQLLLKKGVIAKKDVKKKIKKIVKSVKKDKLKEIKKDGGKSDENGKEMIEEDNIVKDVLKDLLDRVNDEIDIIDNKEAEDKLKKIEEDKLKKIEEDLIKKSKSDVMTRLRLDVERGKKIEKIDDKLGGMDFEYEEELQKLKDKFKEKKMTMLIERDTLMEEKKNQEPIETYDGFAEEDIDVRRFYKHPTYDDAKISIEDMSKKFVKPILDSQFENNPSLLPFEYGKGLGRNIFETHPKFLLDVINKADIDTDAIQMKDILFNIEAAIDDSISKWREELIKTRKKEEDDVRIAKEKEEDAEISGDLDAIRDYLTLEVGKSSDEPVVYKLDNHIIPLMYLYIQEKNNSKCFFNNFDFGDDDHFKSDDRSNYSIRTDGNKIMMDDAIMGNLVESYKNCPENNKMMVVPFLLNSRLKNKSQKARRGHSNLLIFNSVRNEIERFEPHGEETIITGFKNSVLESNIIKHIIKPFNKLAKTDFKFVSSDESCPAGFSGFQDYEGSVLKKSKDLGDEVIVSDPDGYCLSWGMFYFDARLKFPSLTAKRLKKAIFETITTDPETLRNFIRGQMDFVEDEVNKAFKDDDKTYRKYIVLQNIDKRLIGLTMSKRLKEIALFDSTKILLDEYREEIDSYTRAEIEKNIASQMNV